MHPRPLVYGAAGFVFSEWLGLILVLIGGRARSAPGLDYIYWQRISRSALRDDIHVLLDPAGHAPESGRLGSSWLFLRHNFRCRSGIGR